MQKRVLAFLMVIAMVFSLLPVTIVTAEGEEATPGYSVILQKAHNQTEGSLAIDVYLQANTADQAAVTGYNFTVTPAEGLALSGVADATGNDNVKANGDTNVVLYDPTAEKPITVGTSKVLVATLTLAGETLPAQVADAVTVSDAKVTQAEAEFTPVVTTLSYACTDHECAHGTGEWAVLPAANDKGVITLSSGNYYLAGNVNATINLEKDANVNLCLNGFDVVAPAGKKCIAITATGNVLTICDCTGSGEGVDYTSGRLVPCHTWGGAIDVGKDCGATVYMYGGTIDGTATDSVAAKGAGNGVYLRGGNNKITAKGVKFVGLEGYTSGSSFYGPNIFRGEGTSGVFENCTFVDCGTAIIDANNGDGSVNFAPTLVVKDCVITDSQAGAHAIGVKHDEFKSVSIEGDCQFDVPVYVADNQCKVNLNLGSNAKVSILTSAEKTAEELTAMFTVEALGGTVVYENAGAYVSYKDGKFSFSSHKHDDIGFKVWTDPTSLPSEGDWYLDTDVTLANNAPEGKNAEDYACVTVSSGKVLNLDLNGHTITATGNIRIFGLEGGTLSIFDCAEEYDAEGNWIGGQITGSPSKYGAIRLYRGLKNGPASTFNMYGGRLTGNGSATASSNGGALYIYCDRTETNEETGAVTALHKGGVFNMYGGEIYNNHASWAGAAISTWGNDYSKTKESTATINIYGGKIHGNTTSGTNSEGKAEGQGTIYLTSNAVMNVYGGTFENNSVATLGGAIVTNGSATLNIEGGEFIGNAAGTASENYGGAIYLGSKNNTVTIKNATFDGNTASKTAGAIYVYGSCTPTIENCTFTNNVSTSSTGGAIGTTSYSKTLIKDCVFTGNESKGSAGGAIYLAGNSVVTLDNCTITGNNAKSSGAGVYVTNNVNHVILKGNTVIANNKRGGSLSDYANLYFQLNTKNKVDESGNVVYQTNADGSFKLDSKGNKIPEKVNDYRTDAIYVNELGTDARIIAYYNNADITADTAVKIAADGTQTNWDCGSINFGNGKTFQDVSYVDTNADGVKEFIYGHYHMINGQAVPFEAWSSTSAPTDSTKYYYLTKDITANYTVNGTTMNLCFNGHTLTTKSSGRGLVIDGGATVNVYDCTAAYLPDGTYLSGGITGAQYQNYGGAIRVQNGTSAAPNTLNWYGGAIFGCTRTYTTAGSGLGMFSLGGTYANIHWYDGAVHDNVSTNGGATCTGIFCLQGTVNLTIDNIAYYNNTSCGSGGIYNSGGTVIVNNGNFWGNTAATSGAVFQTVKNLTINDGKFWNNNATTSGGVISGCTNVTINGGSFHDNTVGSKGTATSAGTHGKGGVIYTTSNTTITGGTFENNTAYGYGGVFVQANSSNVLTITGTADKPVVFKGNKAEQFYEADTAEDGTVSYSLVMGSGGAIKLNNGTINADYVTFDGNSANKGGAYCIADGTGSKWITNFDHTTFKNNNATYYGGAIAAENGTVTINNCDFKSNAATKSSSANGGAIYFFATGKHTSGETTYTHKVTATIDNCEFSDNSCAGQSGVIHSEKTTTLTVTNSDFIGNYGAEGGVTRTKNAATNVTYEKCNFKNNISNSHGGALSLNYIGTANILDCNFEGNTAKTNGGAIRVDGSSNTTVWNISGCTFKNNTARNGGAIMAEPDNAQETDLKLTNCVIEGNTATDAGAIYVSGNTFAMVVTLDGTTITGNTSENRAAVYASGSEALKLVLKGATVIDGNTCADADSVGSDLYLVHKTLDPEEGSTERIISNVKVDASGLTEGAKIAILGSATRLAGDPVFTLNGGAAQKAYFVSSNTDVMNISTTTVDASEELCFVRYIDEEGNTYANVQAIVDAAVADGVTTFVLPVTSAEDVTLADSLVIDLNGKNLGTVTVPEGKTLTLIDSATNDYDVSDGYGTVKVVGDVRDYYEDDTSGKKRYVVITHATAEDGTKTVSAHRVYLAINSKLLRTKNNGVGFKAIFAGDEVVKANLDDYGIRLAWQAAPTDEGYTPASFGTDFTAGIAGTKTPNQSTAVLAGVVKSTWTEDENKTNYQKDLYGEPYMIVGGVTVKGTVVQTDMEELVASAENSTDSVVLEGVATIKALCGLN